MNRWYLVALLVVVGVLLAVGVFGRNGQEVRTVEVQRGTIREFVDEQGKTRLPDVHVLTAPFEGHLEEAADWIEGQPVAKGQVLAQIAPKELELEVAEAAAAVERLAASLIENDDISVESTGREQAQRFIESMEATVAAAEARKTSGLSRMEFAETQLARARQLARTGATAVQEEERAQLGYVESKVDYQQDVLVAEAMKAMKAATDLLPQMIVEYIGRKGLTHHVLANQKSEAEARLAQARLRGQRATLTSPVDGVILQRRDDQQQYVVANTQLYHIGRLAELEVETEVLTEDSVRIRPGSPAEVYGPAVGALAGKGVPGKVARIFPAGFTKVSSLGVEQQRVMVIVRLAPEAVARLLEQQGLGVDYRVRVRIFTASSPEATLVPRSALFRNPSGEWQVFVVRGGRAVEQTIEVGLMNDEQAEVVSGVTAGELVIVTPESGLTGGARVHVVPSAIRPGAGA